MMETVYIDPMVHRPGSDKSVKIGNRDGYVSPERSDLSKQLEQRKSEQMGIDMDKLPKLPRTV